MEGRRMSFSSHALAIVALCVTSLVVRVLPVFVRLRLNGTARDLVGRVLPLAVFVNFAVYIVWTEIRNAPLPAIVSIAVVALGSFCTRFGLVTITCTATLAYALVTMAWPV
jgi:branched-subunit amino acid transport protein AzlD